MNPIVATWRMVTYRNAYTTPDPAAGLDVRAGRGGARTVRDPRIADYLTARRVRLLRDGLDPVDRALLDPATIRLLDMTAGELTCRAGRLEAVRQ